MPSIDFSHLTLMQAGLLLLAAVVVTVVLSALSSPGGKSGGVGAATWLSVLFIVVVGIGAVWLLLQVMRFTGPDF